MENVGKVEVERKGFNIHSTFLLEARRIVGIGIMNPNQHT